MTKKGGNDMKKVGKKNANNDNNEIKKEENSEKMETDCIGCQDICLLDQIKLSEVELERMCSG